MAFSVGSIQGRLLPPLDGRIQAFPRGRWEEEFQLLSRVGYDSIELTIETASWVEHPINSAQGRDRLRQLSRQWDIALNGICCDVFMETPLVTSDEVISSRAELMLGELVKNAGAVGLPFLEIPFVGKNTLANSSTLERLDRIFDWVLPLAERHEVDILLETDLDPTALSDVLARFRHPRLGLNYDTGNSTWFGFDPVEELRAYHQDIRNIHIKDCTRADYSVPLGTGDTRFDKIFSLLHELGYCGNFIIQAARQEDDIKAASQYLNFASDLVVSYLGPVSGS
jgi:L-ribulose-5-phosphate 3-epimerase